MLLLLLLLSRFSRVRLCVTPLTAAHQAPRPWDSPGKNTGVSCHFLLQCMKVKNESEVAQSCPTLSDLMDCSPPGSVHGIFQARALEWDAIALSIHPHKWMFVKPVKVEWNSMACRNFSFLVLPVSCGYIRCNHDESKWWVSGTSPFGPPSSISYEPIIISFF